LNGGSSFLSSLSFLALHSSCGQRGDFFASNSG
jgi:hypothetical protein